MCLGAEDWTKEVPRIKQVRDRILGAGEAPSIGRGVGAPQIGRIWAKKSLAWRVFGARCW